MKWISGNKRLPEIDDYDFPRQYVVRFKGDDPRSGWIEIHLLTAREIQEQTKYDNYWEWLDESPDVAPVAPNPDDDKAAEEYADRFHKVLPYDHYESDYDYRTQVAKNKQLQEHFLAGCAHKAQSMYSREQMELSFDAGQLYHHYTDGPGPYAPDRDTFINSIHQETENEK